MDSPPPDYHVADSSLRNARTPVLLAVVVSSCVHLIAVFLWPEPGKAQQFTATTVELEMLRTAPAYKNPVEESLQDDLAPESHSLVESKSVVPKPARQPELVAEPVVPELIKPASGRLKLQSPENWDEVLMRSAEPSMTIADLPFHPQLRAELDAARDATARRELLAARQRQVAGLSESEFGSLQGYDSDTMKIDGRCFTLRPSASVSNDAQWWSEICRDSRQHPATLQRLEYDPTGRVVAD